MENTDEFKTLDVPIMITEQYPKGLGTTIPQISEVLGTLRSVEKIAFSCCDEPGFQQVLEETSRKNVIISGIEAHVCVLQTAVDLISSGYQPVVVADCISSRNPEDKNVALDRMRTEGSMVTTCESILFELAGTARTEEFKTISGLVK
jgi:nicotinamidase-related amidase